MTNTNSQQVSREVVCIETLKVYDFLLSAGTARQRLLRLRAGSGPGGRGYHLRGEKGHL